jgi:hypothetical protein
VKSTLVSCAWKARPDRQRECSSLDTTTHVVDEVRSDEQPLGKSVGIDVDGKVVEVTVTKSTVLNSRNRVEDDAAE